MRESPGPTGTGHDLAHIRNLSSVVTMQWKVERLVPKTLT
jgi:hypothetical protein